VNVERVNNAQVAADIVIDQDPAANEEAKEGSSVTLTVSAGAGQVEVPKVDNASFEDAQRALSAAGFQVQRRDEASDTVDAGDVIRTDPAGGTSAVSGSTVAVFVSTGSEQIAIPDVRNLTADEASARLGDAGFSVREASEASSSVENGHVTRTDPAAGAMAARGSAVRMFVSTGTEAVEVPEVRGQTEADAKAALSARGLSSSTIAQVDPGNVGKVVAQSPGGGTRVQPGSNVVLTIATDAPATTTTTTTTTQP
jgi:eukaryotic-like serine/threonine-protein kinase